MKRIVSKPTPNQRATTGASTTPPPAAAKPAARSAPAGAAKKSPAPAAAGAFDLDKIKQIEADRKARRQGAAQAKTDAVAKVQAYKDAGIVGDYQFIEMIQVPLKGREFSYISSENHPRIMLSGVTVRTALL
jgi:hypothetical protein